MKQMIKKRMPERVYRLGNRATDNNVMSLTPTALVLVLILRKGPITRAKLVKEYGARLRVLRVRQSSQEVLSWWSKKLIKKGILRIDA